MGGLHSLGALEPPTETELLGPYSVLYCFHTSQGLNFVRVPGNHRSGSNNRYEKENKK